MFSEAFTLPATDKMALSLPIKFFNTPVSLTTGAYGANWDASRGLGTFGNRCVPADLGGLSQFCYNFQQGLRFLHKNTSADRDVSIKGFFYIKSSEHKCCQNNGETARVGIRMAHNLSPFIGNLLHLILFKAVRQRSKLFQSNRHGKLSK